MTTIGAVNASENFLYLLACAERHLDRHTADPSLAVYMLRDQPETEEAGLKELAWAYIREGWIPESEARAFLDDMKQALNYRSEMLLGSILGEIAALDDDDDWYDDEEGDET